ncbi:MAG: hypothetical protein KJ583_05930 [Nanoarchaeota archaeon]|nr:hypothetical protein [Nanoarchaeota archaeon]MBU1270394.1 hypothetical protein [Nanoarchaeota archaeon]MBU1604825.1 hypothetical protein [Nanoarchaeota archaeon]MBU2442808.1 hypothetical protein [Nanoarchaeota archaeon]
MNLAKEEITKEKKISKDFKVVKHESEGGLLSHGRLITKFKDRLVRGGKKFLMGLLVVLALSGNIKAGTKDIYPDVKKFIEATKTEQMTQEDAINRFRIIMKDIDKEVKDDLDKHNYEDAERLLELYMRVAEYVGDSELRKELLELWRDVRSDLNSKIKEYGVFEYKGKIYVVGEVNSNDFSTARSKSSFDAQNQLMRKIRGENHSFSGIIKRESLIEVSQIKSGVYKYIISFDEVDNANFTQQLLKNLPKLPI